MSRVTKREWYRRVNAEWEGVTIPPLTEGEAVRAAKKLYRFARKSTFTGKVRVTSGRNRSWARQWEIVVNPALGWKSLIHDISHDFERGPHGSDHARMEMRLIKEVKRRGWLDGKLKPEPKPEPAKPTKAVIVNAKLDHAQKMLLRATTRAKRATTILKKWQRKVRYYERRTVTE